MKNVFLDGLTDGGTFVEELLGSKKTTKENSETEDPFAKEHFRLAWVFYIEPDCVNPPTRDFYRSDFHKGDQRIPRILTGILTSGTFKKQSELKGLFPEPINAQEDLGYVVFSSENAGRRFAAELSDRLSELFDASAPQLIYAEFELLKCYGLIDAPSFIVQKEVLLNSAFDSAGISTDNDGGESDQIIEIRQPIG